MEDESTVAYTPLADETPLFLSDLFVKNVRENRLAFWRRSDDRKKLKEAVFSRLKIKKRMPLIDENTGEAIKALDLSQLIYREENLRVLVSVINDRLFPSDIKDILSHAVSDSDLSESRSLLEALRACPGINLTDFKAVKKAVDKIDHELLQQFDIKNYRLASEVIASIEALILLGLDVKAKDKSGSTLLHKFLQQVPENFPHEELRAVFNYFRKKGADFNARDARGNTPLHIAVRRYLISVVADPEFSEDSEEVNDLFSVVNGGAVKFLVEEFGAIIELTNNKLKTPRDVRGFLFRGNDYLKLKESPLHLAIERCDVDQFEERVRYAVDHPESYDAIINIQRQPLGTPIQHLERLIQQYKSEKKMHTPRQWYRHNQLIKMRKIYNDLMQVNAEMDSRAVSAIHGIAARSGRGSRATSVYKRLLDDSDENYFDPDQNESISDEEFFAPPVSQPTQKVNPLKELENWIALEEKQLDAPIRYKGNIAPFLLVAIFAKEKKDVSRAVDKLMDNGLERVPHFWRELLDNAIDSALQIQDAHRQYIFEKVLRYLNNIGKKLPEQAQQEFAHVMNDIHGEGSLGHPIRNAFAAAMVAVKPTELLDLMPRQFLNRDTRLRGLRRAVLEYSVAMQEQAKPTGKNK